MIDSELVNRKLTLITEDLEKLEEFSDLKRGEYLDDEPIRLQVERLLERVINRLIDLNFHITTEACNRQPRDYYDSFILMSRTGLYDAERAERWAALAGLRNRLAHEYNGLDHKRVYDSFLELVDDLPTLLESLQEKFG